MKQGAANEVAVITGYVAGDCTSPIKVDSDTFTAADYEKAVKKAFGDLADRVLALYPATDENARDVVQRLDLDYTRTNLFQDGEAVIANSANPAYLYTYSWPYAGLVKQGAFHSSDIPYWLGGVFTEAKTWSNTDYSLAKTMSGYLVNFAKTGDVNGDGLPYWAPYTSGSSTYLCLNDAKDISSKVMSGDKLALWADYAEWLKNKPADEEEALGPNSRQISWSDSLADCNGILTVEAATNTWTVVFTNSFNPTGYHIEGTYDPDTYALTVLKDAGLGGFLELEPLQAVAGPAIRDILFSKEIAWSDSLADCVGTVTIYPESNTWAITFTNSFKPTGYNIKGTYDPATYALTVTDDDGLGGFLELEPLQAVAGPAIRDILFSKAIAWSDSLADCVGTVTIYPESNTWAITFTNSFKPTGYNIKGTYDPATYILTVTNDDGLGGFLELEPLQAVAGPAIKAILSK